MSSRRPAQPVASRRVFGAMLRRYRMRAGLTQVELGAKVHLSGDMISKIEKGERAASPDLRARLDAVPELATDGALARPPEKLGEGMYLLAVPPWYVDFAAKQMEAANLRCYELSVVPGLLQTEAYAYAIFRTRFNLTEDEIDELVTARLKRQETLTRKPPPGLWVIVDEGVLHRPVGGRHVMLEQIALLIEAAQRPNVVLQVIPASVGAHEGLAGSFHIADFDDAPSVGHMQAATRGYTVDNQKDIAALELTWNMVRTEALPRGASLALLEDIAKSWASAV